MNTFFKKLLFLVFVALSACHQENHQQETHSEVSSSKEAFQEIEAILFRQQDDWNNGDLEGFMNGYWTSDSLKFMGKSGVTYGWNDALARYQKSYSSQDEMGKLKFTLLHQEMISQDAVIVIGKWELFRKEDLGKLEGHFSLLWRKINGSWVITVDHSS